MKNQMTNVYPDMRQIGINIVKAEILVSKHNMQNFFLIGLCYTGEIYIALVYHIMGCMYYDLRCSLTTYILGLFLL